MGRGYRGIPFLWVAGMVAFVVCWFGLLRWFDRRDWRRDRAEMYRQAEELIRR